jgi:hypothetical protein
VSSICGSAALWEDYAPAKNGTQEKFSLDHARASANLSAMNTAQEIADTLGREEIAARVGVRPSAVDQAVRTGKLPAAWYVVCKDMAKRRPLPVHCFTFKGLAGLDAK